jgi:protoporphyrinogen IX oxidase
MVLVALLLACVIYGGVLFKKSLAGDKEAGQRAVMVRQISGLAFLGILLSAVFAFN